MPRIVPRIETLDQHRLTLFSDPERYRPDACAQCGLAHPWAHGCYTRKSDRPPNGEGRRNPIPIPRFRCRNPDCGHTCSRLPDVIRHLLPQPELSTGAALRAEPGFKA